MYLLYCCYLGVFADILLLRLNKKIKNMWYNCHPKWIFFCLICVIFVYQIAVPDLVEAAKDADIYIFVIPHQFLPKVCDQMKAVVKPTALGVSLIKACSSIFHSMFFKLLKQGLFIGLFLSVNLIEISFSKMCSYLKMILVPLLGILCTIIPKWPRVPHPLSVKKVNNPDTI